MRLQTAELARVDLERMSTADLAGFCGRMLSLEFEGWDLLYLATQAVALPFFQKACHDWLADPHLTLGYRLFAGLGGLPEVEAGLALWRLAALARADELTQDVVTKGGDWTQTRRRLAQTEHGRQFLAAWAEFMTEHGHHCRGELELINARWCEQPDYILGLLRGYVNSAGRLNPPENQECLAKERLRLTEACRRRLRHPVKRWIFQVSLKRAQQLAVNREVWKDQAVRRIHILRRILVILGHRLSGQGVLGTSDDIFFLETGELHRILHGDANFDVRDCVRRRRLEYEIHRQIPAAPGIVRGSAHGKSATPNPRRDGEEDTLKGIPVSPGIVTGRARVILRDDDHEQILPGEILVAPFTDPAWTPYFVTASGVIMEQGGILSHGSIVAREFGLPAVTNVEAVTRRLRTGDWVELDGDRGRVTVLRPV
jgi:pyruvate,water dikinase